MLGCLLVCLLVRFFVVLYWAELLPATVVRPCTCAASPLCLSRFGPCHSLSLYSLLVAILARALLRLVSPPVSPPACACLLAPCRGFSPHQSPRLCLLTCPDMCSARLAPVSAFGQLRSLGVAPGLAAASARTAGRGATTAVQAGDVAWEWLLVGFKAAQTWCWDLFGKCSPRRGESCRAVGDALSRRSPVQAQYLERLWVTCSRSTLERCDQVSCRRIWFGVEFRGSTPRWSSSHRRSSEALIRVAAAALWSTSRRLISWQARHFGAPSAVCVAGAILRRVARCIS